MEVVEAHLFDEGRHLHLHLTRERMKPMTTVYHNMQLSHGGSPDKPAIPGQCHFELVRSHVHVRCMVQMSNYTFLPGPCWDVLLPSLSHRRWLCRRGHTPHRQANQHEGLHVLPRLMAGQSPQREGSASQSGGREGGREGGKESWYIHKHTQ